MFYSQQKDQYTAWPPACSFRPEPVSRTLNTQKIDSVYSGEKIELKELFYSDHKSPKDTKIQNTNRKQNTTIKM
jgi:hypothetical protein